MKRTFLVAAFWLSWIGAAAAQDIGGDWQGSLKAGPSDLRVRLHVLPRDGGGWKATFDSVDQGANDIPVSAITFDPPLIRFSIELIRASYEGRINLEGTAIDGAWMQGQSFSLTLSRIKAGTNTRSEGVRPKFDPAAIAGRLLRHAPADPQASERIARLREEMAAGNSDSASRFWEEMRASGSPLIEPVPGESHYSFVTFLWRGTSDTRNVAIVGGVAGADPMKNQMIHIEASDVWYKTYKIGNDSRFTYALSPNDSGESLDRLDPNDLVAMLKRMSTFQRDPLNPNQVFGAMPSFVELAEAPPQPWIVPSANAPKGTLRQEPLASTILKNQRNVWVYTPPGFRVDGPRYPLLIAFDGAAYTSNAGVPVPVILDNLIAGGKTPPMVAIVLDNPTAVSRNTELACSPDFTDFLAEEVVPWMRQRFHATTDAAETVVAGSSLGGLAAICAGLQKNLVFGNVLSQSGAVWWVPGNPDAEPGWLMRKIAEEPTRNLRVFLEVGLMEADAVLGQSMLSSNRHLRDVLMARSYPLSYREFLGGHEPANWRGGFAEGLMFLIGEK